MNEAMENVCVKNDGTQEEVHQDGVSDDGMARLLLSWIDWVEVEVQGVPDLVEELRMLRGAVMVAALVGGP